MARQSTAPVAFEKTTRPDDVIAMTSGRAGVCQPLDYIPLLRGDSASGAISVKAELGEMPRPLLNGVMFNFQAWFVSKSAHPQFAGNEDFMHSYLGDDITTSTGTRTPPPFFTVLSDVSDLTELKNSTFMKGLGQHIPTDRPTHTDLVDAFNLIYNFRLAAHSSRLTRRKYASEDLTEALALPPAFWPTGRFSRVVSDYERALIVGSLDLDVTAGQLPISGLGTNAATWSAVTRKVTGGEDVAGSWTNMGGASLLQDDDNPGYPAIFAEMEGQQVGVTLADIDKARTTQAFAKLRTAYAGNDTTGFDNDDTIVATLMQGFTVPEETWRRPVLLDSKRVPVGFTERKATDGASLDASVSEGETQVLLSVNLPAVPHGGVIMITAELLPERIYERQSDEWLHIVDTADFPDALRDIQRPEPVDTVLNRRLDVAHTSAAGLYGYEYMNDVWNREFTRLGGAFWQDDPENPYTDQRSGIWQSSIVDPQYDVTHFLAPDDFPHDVFADTEADAYEAVVRHNLAVVGLTQMGDMLAENNDDYEAVQIEAE